LKKKGGTYGECRAAEKKETALEKQSDNNREGLGEAKRK